MKNQLREYLRRQPLCNSGEHRETARRLENDSVRASFSNLIANLFLLFIFFSKVASDEKSEKSKKLVRDVMTRFAQK